MKGASHTVVGLGEALWDLLPSGKHLGGAPLNFAYISSLLGEQALICTRIGDDPLGNEIQAELRARKLSLNGIQTDPELPTGTVAVSFKDGQPEYEIRRPAAWDALEWSPKWCEIASKSDAICFGTLAQRTQKSQKTVHKFVENAPNTCLKVCDINLRRPFFDAQIIESTLQLATILKLNDIELAEIAAMFAIKSADPVAQMRELLRRFDLKCVFVTRGERGAMATNGAETVEHPGFLVQIRDTIGAGDAFTAAAIHCLLAKKDLKTTLATANKWAAWVASQPGGMPKMERNQLKMMTDFAENRR